MTLVLFLAGWVIANLHKELVPPGLLVDSELQQPWGMGRFLHLSLAIKK